MAERRERDHHRQRPGRATRPRCTPSRANLSPLVDRGLPVGRAAAADDRGRELPRLPGGGIAGPRADAEASATRPRTSARASSPTRPRGRARRPSPAAIHEVYVGDEVHQARTVILAMGAEHKKLGVPGEEELAGARRLLLRDVRRRLLQRPGDHGRRRRRQRDGGGDVPGQVRPQGACSSTAATSSAPRRSWWSARGRWRTSSSRRPTWSRRSSTATGRSSASRGCKQRRDRRDRGASRSAARSSPIGHEPQSEIVDGVIEVDDEGYVKVDGRSTRTEPARRLRRRRPGRPHLPPGDHRRGLGLPGRAGRRVVPARHAADPDAAVAGRGRPRRGAVGAAGLAGVSVVTRQRAGCDQATGETCRIGRGTFSTGAASLR